MDNLDEEMDGLEGISLPDSGDEDEFDLDDLVLPDLESVEYEAPERQKIVLPDAVNESANHIFDDYVPPREVDDYNYRNVKYGDYDSGRGVRSHESMHPDTYSGVLDKLPGDLVFDDTGGFSTEDTSLKEFPGFYTEEDDDSEDDLDDIMASFDDEQEDLMSEFSDTMEDSDEDESDEIPGFDDIMDDDDDGFGSDDIFGGEEELDEDTLKIKNFDLDEVIDVAIKRKASDLHLVGDDYVLLTIHDEIQRIDDFGVLPFDLVDHLMLEILTNVLETEFVDELELDTSYVVRTGPSKGRRSRLNVAKSLNKVTMTFRIVSDVIPPPDELGIPQVMQDWIKLPSGLIMVNGPTGTGKALYIDELVPTVGGMKRVGDVRLGETLFDETGAETEVIGVHPSEDIESFDLLFENGERVRAAGSHLWKVKYLGGEVVSSRSNVFSRLLIGEDFVEAKERLLHLSDLDEVIALKDVFPLFPRSSPVELYDVILRECTEVSEKVFRLSDVLTVLLEESLRREDRVHLSAEGVSFVLTTRELADVMRYDSEWGVELLTSPVEFATVELPMDSYSAGLFLASKLSDVVGLDQRIFHPEAEEVLEEAGSLESLLNLYSHSSSESRLDFLAGVLDLLGSVSESGVTVESSSSLLLRGVRSLVSSMGWLVKGDGSYIIFTPDRQVFRDSSEEVEALEEVLGDLTPPDVLKIISVQRSGVVRSGEFICFEVDSDSSLFLTSESFIPTHNTTTLASLLNEVNLYENKKIVTVENPVEFLYGNQGKGLVVQREVGKDTRSFTKALNSAMRQNPNLILIGEVRDRVEIDALVRSAESGHLAVSTMHTVSAPMTISRIMSLYVGDEQSRIMGTLADVSRGFANQTLLRRKDGKGMVAVREVLPITPEVSELIRNGDVAGIRSYQMDHEITMDHELIAEVKRGTVTLETARLESTYPDFFDELANENSLNF